MKPRISSHASPPPKCGRCDGWAFEPGANPLQPCAACTGTGWPPAAEKPQHTGELIDG